MPNGAEKNFVRLCAAINGFRARYGAWPTFVRIYPAALADLRDLILTSEDFAKLEQKVRLVCEDGPMVAEDESGRRYDYGNEGFSEIEPDIHADQWLGILPRPDLPHFG